MNTKGSVSVTGVALCGIVIEDATGNKAMGRILGVQGIGASRMAIPATTNDSPELWGEFIYSCIAVQKPFRVTMGLNQNDIDWVEDIQSGKRSFSIDLPPEEGYDSGENISTEGGYTDFEAGGELQSMMMCSVTIQPTGKPVLTAGVET